MSMSLLQFVTAVTIVLLWAVPAQADFIYLSNGEVLEGRVLSESADGVIVEAYGGEITFNRSDIKAIERRALPQVEAVVEPTSEETALSEPPPKALPKTKAKIAVPNLASKTRGLKKQGSKIAESVKDMMQKVKESVSAASRRVQSGEWREGIGSRRTQEIKDASNLSKSPATNSTGVGSSSIEKVGAYSGSSSRRRVSRPSGSHSK